MKSESNDQLDSNEIISKVLIKYEEEIQEIPFWPIIEEILSSKNPENHTQSPSITLFEGESTFARALYIIYSFPFSSETAKFNQSISIIFKILDELWKFASHLQELSSDDSENYLENYNYQIAKALSNIISYLTFSDTYINSLIDLVFHVFNHFSTIKTDNLEIPHPCLHILSYIPPSIVAKLLVPTAENI